jgi:hypothetical protein
VSVSNAEEAGQVVLEAHKRALRGESVTFEFERDGKPYQAVVDPLRDMSGRLIGSVGIAMNLPSSDPRTES